MKRDRIDDHYVNLIPAVDRMCQTTLGYVFARKDLLLYGEERLSKPEKKPGFLNNEAIYLSVSFVCTHPLFVYRAKIPRALKMVSACNVIQI